MVDLMRKHFLAVIDAPHATGKSYAASWEIARCFSESENHSGINSCIVFGQHKSYPEYLEKFDDLHATWEMKEFTSTELFALKYDLVIVDGCIEELRKSTLCHWLAQSKKLVVIHDSTKFYKEGSTIEKVKALCNDILLIVICHLERFS